LPITVAVGANRESKGILTLAHLQQDQAKIFMNRLKNGESTERLQREAADSDLCLNVRSQEIYVEKLDAWVMLALIASPSSRDALL